MKRLSHDRSPHSDHSAIITIGARQAWSWLDASLSIVLISLFTISASGHAAPLFKLRGYGTVGVTHSSLNEADFVGSPLQSKGAGASQQWSWGVDSKLGLQLNADISERLEAVVQVASQNRIDAGYRPKLEWANLKYRFSPYVSLRIGRIVLPAFMVSEARLVGYANVWVRPPLETYSVMPFTNSDGIDLALRKQIGGVTSSLQLLRGHLESSVVAETAAGTQVRNGKFRDITGVVYSAEYGPWLGRAAYITADAESEGIERRLKFHNVGIGYDAGDWFVQGELSQLQLPVFTSGIRAVYVSAGVRMGSFTPYMIYSMSRPRDRSPSVLANDQRSVSAGLRWDVAKNMAIKTEINHIKLNAGSGGNGYFINIQPGFAPGNGGNVFSVVLDFVF